MNNASPIVIAPDPATMITKPVMADEDCINAVNKTPNNTNNNGKSNAWNKFLKAFNTSSLSKA